MAVEGLCMSDINDLDLRNFLPYLLTIAAEQASLGFKNLYKDRYGLLRAEWRVLFHLGRYGSLTAKEICARAPLHKTKVSRAVRKLEERRFVVKKEVEADRRHAMLSLTKQGQVVYEDLQNFALLYDEKLSAKLSKQDNISLRRALKILASLPH